MPITTEDLTRKIDLLQSEIAQMERELERKRGKLDAWTELADEATKPAFSSPATPRARRPLPSSGKSRQKSGLPGDGQKPARAVVELLSKSPGLKMVEIISTLENRVQSVAKNKRHNLRTTLFNMVRTQKITRDKEDRYYVKNGSDA